MTDKTEIRKQIMQAWKAKSAAYKVLRATPEYEAHRQAKESLEELYEEYGEPFSHCESCGVPFLEGDKVFAFQDGEHVCLMEGNPTGETGPCYGELAGIKEPNNR